MEKKHHYRLIAKSDHLGAADLEDFIESGKQLVFKIKEVKQELKTTVAGKTGDFNIAYFYENIKPLVLNQTNCKVLRNFAKDKSPFVEDWKDIEVELYIDHNVKLKGDTVGGVRIKSTKPVSMTKEKAEAILRTATTLDMLRKLFESLPPAIQKEVNTLKDELKTKLK